MDGIDAALVRLPGAPTGPIELLEFHTSDYDAELTAALRGISGDAVEMAVLDAAVGEAFADAALELLAAAEVEAGAVDCIGSHGQTVAHVPEPRAVGKRLVRATLQLGQPAVIAERTGITTVADFRARDMAAGGQGAPLVPLLDYRLYRHAEIGRVALNIGGIANLTVLPPDADLAQVRAFDTGPGNVLLDAAARRRGLRRGFDEDGELGLAGGGDE